MVDDYDVKNGVGSGQGLAWAFATYYYPDRLRDSLPCSEWERVLALSYGRQLRRYQQFSK